MTIELQPVSGTVGPSVFEETATVHVAALRPPPSTWPLCHLVHYAANHAREKTGIRQQWGSRVAWGSGLQGFMGELRVAWGSLTFGGLTARTKLPLSTDPGGSQPARGETKGAPH